MPGETRERYRWLAPAVFVACYLALASRWMGLSFYDDSLYFTWATQLHARDFVYRLDGAPLYCAWLRLPGYFLHDAVVWYMVAWGLLVVALCCVPLFFRSRLAWAYTLLLLLLPFFEVNIYVSHFAAFFLTCGAATVLRWKLTASAAACVACCACFLAAFARPEYAYGVLIAAAAGLIAILIERPRRALGRLVPLAALVCTMLFCVRHTGSTRSGFAFSQHFNVRAAAKGLIPAQGDWNSTYALQRFHIRAKTLDYIPDASIGDFYRANPQLFLGQVRDNLFDPHTIAAFCLLGVVLLAAWLRRERRAAALYVALVSAPVVCSVLLIYPRPHYLVIVLPALLLTALSLLPERLSLARPPLWLLLPVGCLLIALKAHYLAHHYLQFNTSDKQSLATVRCIRALQDSGPPPGSVLDTVTSQFDDIYLRAPLRRIPSHRLENWSSYRRAVLDSRPAWIIERDNDDYYGQPAGTAAAFLSAQQGYTAHPCPAGKGLVIYTLP